MWNCLSKALVESETEDAFKHRLKVLNSPPLVPLATLVFILQYEFLLIIYSDSDFNQLSFVFQQFKSQSNVLITV